MKLKIPREAPPVAERPTGGPWGELPPRGLEGMGIEIAHANLFGRMVAALMGELPERPTYDELWGASVGFGVRVDGPLRGAGSADRIARGIIRLDRHVAVETAALDRTHTSPGQVLTLMYAGFGHPHVRELVNTKWRAGRLKDLLAGCHRARTLAEQRPVDPAGVGELHALTIGAPEVRVPARLRVAHAGPQLEQLCARHAAHAGHHPLLSGAWLLHAFDRLRPFAQGNGPTGRHVLNWHLMHNAWPPVLLHREDGERLAEGLRAADGNDYGPLVEVLQRASHRSFRELLADFDDGERTDLLAAHASQTGPPVGSAPPPNRRGGPAPGVRP